jgi:hypothetical protein
MIFGVPHFSETVEMLGGFLGQTYGTYSPSAMRTEWVIRFLFSWFVFLGCAVSCAFFGYEI